MALYVKNMKLNGSLPNDHANPYNILSTTVLSDNGDTRGSVTHKWLELCEYNSVHMMYSINRIKINNKHVFKQQIASGNVSW